MRLLSAIPAFTLVLLSAQPALALRLVSDPLNDPSQAEVTHCRAFINTFPVTQPVPHLVLTAPINPTNRACDLSLDQLTPGRYRANAAAAILDPVTGVTKKISRRSNVVDFTVTLAVPANLTVVVEPPPAPATTLRVKLK